jgi:hypothetical protein
VDCAASGVPNLKSAGPEIFVHKKLAMFPSGSLEALPFKITVLLGKKIVVSLPALAIGGF